MSAVYSIFERGVVSSVFIMTEVTMGPAKRVPFSDSVLEYSPRSPSHRQSGTGLSELGGVCFATFSSTLLYGAFPGRSGRAAQIRS